MPSKGLGDFWGGLLFLMLQLLSEQKALILMTSSILMWKLLHRILIFRDVVVDVSRSENALGKAEMKEEIPFADGVPVSLPAMSSIPYAGKARGVWAWLDSLNRLGRLEEEIAEFQAWADRISAWIIGSRIRRCSCFSLSNYARFLESIRRFLERTTKIIKRFQYLEKEAAKAEEWDGWLLLKWVCNWK